MKRMGKDIDLIRSLQLCAEMFDWWAEHPGNDKSEWPGWANEEIQEYGDPDDWWYCFCCLQVGHFKTNPIEDDEGEREHNRISGTCKKCALLNLWWDFSSGDSWEGVCMDSTISPYEKWRAEDGTRDPKYAKQISDYCRTKISALLKAEEISQEDLEASSNFLDGLEIKETP